MHTFVVVLVVLGGLLFLAGLFRRADQPEARRYGATTVLVVLASLGLFGLGALFMSFDSRDRDNALEAIEDAKANPDNINAEYAATRARETLAYGGDHTEANICFGIAGFLLLITPLTKTTPRQDLFAGAAAALIAAGGLHSAQQNWQSRP